MSMLYYGKNVLNKVSHKFGYGLMDGGALVTMAEQWTNVPTQRICKAREDNKQRCEYEQIITLKFVLKLINI